MSTTSITVANKMNKLASKLFTSQVRRSRSHANYVRQGTRGTFVRKHVSMQGTLTLEHLSTQGTLARKHTRHVGT